MATPLNYNNIKLRYKATAWGILLLYVGCPKARFFHHVFHHKLRHGAAADIAVADE